MFGIVKKVISYVGLIHRVLYNSVKYRIIHFARLRAMEGRNAFTHKSYFSNSGKMKYINNSLWRLWAAANRFSELLQLNKKTRPTWSFSAQKFSRFLFLIS